MTIAVVPMVFAETALRPMRSSERPEFRRVRSAATARFTLALAALYCSFFVYAAARRRKQGRLLVLQDLAPERIDAQDRRQFERTGQSRRVLPGREPGAPGGRGAT